MNFLIIVCISSPDFFLRNTCCGPPYLIVVSFWLYSMSLPNHQYTHTCGIILPGVVTTLDFPVWKGKRDNLREQSLARDGKGPGKVFTSWGVEKNWKQNNTKQNKKKTKQIKKKKKIVAMFTAGLSVVPDLKNPEHLHLAHSSASSVVRQVQDWLPASAVPVAVHCNKITQMTDTRKFKDFEVNQIL